MAKPKKKHYSKRFRAKIGTIGIVLLVLFALGALFGTNAIKIYELKRQKADIESQLEEANKKSEELDDDIKQIGTKNYIELIARKYLGLYYPDEKIVVPVEGKDNNTQPTPSPSPSPSPSPAEDTPKNNNEKQSEGTE